MCRTAGQGFQVARQPSQRWQGGQQWALARSAAACGVALTAGRAWVCQGELSRVTTPVQFLEPLSELQQRCEDMEFSELLDQARAPARSQPVPEQLPEPVDLHTSRKGAAQGLTLVLFTERTQGAEAGSCLFKLEPAGCLLCKLEPASFSLAFMTSW